MGKEASKAKAQAVPNLKLREQREKRHWTQTELARKLGTTYLTVCRWENGVTSPSLYYRKTLCELFQLSGEELGLNISVAETQVEQQAFVDGENHERIWHLPFRRNPFFTGREQLLARLHTVLMASRATTLSQIQALSGLGGIGKTQTAIEYAFRHREEYQAVLWIRAENRAVWYGDLLSLAKRLKLLGQEEQDVEYARLAVIRWLETHTNWLVILDNIEDLTLIDELIPTEPHGHILLTIRAQSTGSFAQRLDIEQMSVDEGAFLLLRRAKLLGPDAPLEAAGEVTVRQAKEICVLLGGLPLALDQAGAYIEETGCSLQDYQEHYQVSRRTLLQRRGLSSGEHPQSVSATVMLCLKTITQKHPAAIELLRLCTFLDPDAIAEELFTQGASDLGPLLAPLAASPVSLNMLFAALRSYSLMHRLPERKMLTIHRLVQAILKDDMDETLQQQWVERCVRAVRRTFPEPVLAFWDAAPRHLPQAQRCANLVIQRRMTFPEARQLLDLTGYYVMQQGQYEQAERFLQQGLQLTEEVVGSEHSDFAVCLEHMGELYWHTNRLEESRAMKQRALELLERAYGPDHPEVAGELDSLALTYRTLGHPDLAEPLFLRSYAICQQRAEQGRLFALDAHIMASCAENLGILYIEQGKFAQAEPLLLHALTLSKQLCGDEHLLTAYAYHNLGYLHEWQGDYDKAAEWYNQALAIREKMLDCMHPNIGATLHNLARVYQRQAQYLRAEELFRRALSIRENTLGAEHREVAHTLSQMGSLYLEQEQAGRALPLLIRALAIREKALGPDHPEVAWDLEALAQAQEMRGNYGEARQLVERALTIYETRLGRDHLDSVESLLIVGNLAGMQGQYEEAEEHVRRALGICERLLSATHPKIATCLRRLAELYVQQKRTAEAQQLLQRALMICEEQLGSTHPETTAIQVYSAGLAEGMGRINTEWVKQQQGSKRRERRLLGESSKADSS